LENQIISFPPPIPISIAILAGIAIGPLLLLLSYKPFRIAGTGHRLLVAIALSVTAWLAASWLSGAFAVGFAEVLGNVIVGALILAGASIVAFIPWSLLNWGFTLTLLLNIANEAKPITLEGWMDRFGGSDDGSQALFNGRLRMLISTGMATADGQQIKLTRYLGNFTGFVSTVAAILFNIQG